MVIENPLRLVRELKGAPLSILFALSIVQQRVTQSWIERTTGYTDKTISKALAYLEEVGMVDQTSAGWMLTGEVKQLPLMVELLEPGASRNFSDPTTTSLINLSSKESLKEVEEAEIFRPPSNLVELKRHGIGEPMATRLSQLEWVNQNYILRLAGDLRRRGKLQPGLLIVRIQAHDVVRSVYGEDLTEVCIRCGITFPCNCEVYDTCPICQVQTDERGICPVCHSICYYEEV
jgi:hypothetical protein